MSHPAVCPLTITKEHPGSKQKYNLQTDGKPGINRHFKKTNIIKEKHKINK